MEKKNTFMIVMIVMLSLSLVGAVSYIIYDKVNNNVDNNNIDNTSNNVNTNTNETTKPVTYEKINIEIVKDLNSEFGATYLKINGKEYKDIGCPFGCAEGMVEQFADLIMVRVLGTSVDKGLVFYDKNGNKVATIGGSDSIVKGQYVDLDFPEIIDGNDIIVRTTDVASDNLWGMCEKIDNQKKSNQPGLYLYKLTYLGNNKFAEPKILSTISASDYENQKGLDCDKCLNSGKPYSAENNCKK